MRQPRLYGLYRVIKAGTRKVYIRKYPVLAYPQPQAARVFQNSLLAGALGGEVCELRPLRNGLFAQ